MKHDWTWAGLGEIELLSLNSDVFWQTINWNLRVGQYCKHQSVRKQALGKMCQCQQPMIFVCYPRSEIFLTVRLQTAVKVSCGYR